MIRTLAALLPALALVACTDQVVERRTLPASTATTPAEEEEAPAATDVAAPPSATSTTPDAPPPPPPPPCATTLGAAITPTHGRLDGTVRAVIAPGDKVCRGDNDHVIVQIDAGGATYAAWVNVESNIVTSDPAVRYGEARAPMPSGAWSEGWHPGEGDLDYGASLGVHTGDFTPTPKATLAASIAARLPAGARVSAYFDGFATGDGGHKIHRNGGGRDGALVVHEATGQPRWLLFHFAQQVF